MPTPVAASLTSGSTPATPAQALTRIGGIASTTSGSSQVSVEKPRNTASRMSRPRVGIDRQALAMLTTTTVILPPRWPIATPAGIAISAATTSGSRL